MRIVPVVLLWDRGKPINGLRVRLFVEEVNNNNLLRLDYSDVDYGN